MIITNKRVLPEELWLACNPSLTAEPRIPFEGTIVEPETLTAEQLIAELEKLPPETPIYRHDCEYGAEAIDRVWIDPDGYDKKWTIA